MGSFPLSSSHPAHCFSITPFQVKTFMMKATFHICSLVLFEYEVDNRWFAEPDLIQGYRLSATAFKIIGAESAILTDKIKNHRCSRSFLLQILPVKIRLQ